jgi:hypothetical protein
VTAICWRSPGRIADPYYIGFGTAAYYRLTIQHRKVIFVVRRCGCGNARSESRGSGSSIWRRTRRDPERVAASRAPLGALDGNWARSEWETIVPAPTLTLEVAFRQKLGMRIQNREPRNTNFRRQAPGLTEFAALGADCHRQWLSDTRHRSASAEASGPSGRPRSLGGFRWLLASVRRIIMVMSRSNQVCIAK